jgi:hypothetical protein
MARVKKREIEPIDERTHDEMVAEFLANGGKVQVLEPYARSENVEYKGGFWGRRKKKEEDPKKEE